MTRLGEARLFNSWLLIWRLSSGESCYQREIFTSGVCDSVAIRTFSIMVRRSRAYAACLTSTVGSVVKTPAQSLMKRIGYTLRYSMIFISACLRCSLVAFGASAIFNRSIMIAI